MPFHDSGAPGQGEAGDDGVTAAVDACGEGVETGQIILADGIESASRSLGAAQPGVQTLLLQVNGATAVVAAAESFASSVRSLAPGSTSRLEATLTALAEGRETAAARRRIERSGHPTA